MGEFTVDDVTCRYGSAEALSGVCLDFPPGRITAIIGPSGCGKTTLLRVLAGLTAPSAGRVVLDGLLANDPAVRIPPEARGVGMVFQDSLLWPHLSVRGNIAFPLGPGHRQDPRVKEAAEACEVAPLLDCAPTELSGGEQRRAAVARAIVSRPRLLLLDEPLTGLDANLRVRLLAAIRDIQRRLGVTTVCVTHDQEEALGLADLVAVLRGGRVVQTGTPADVYARPASGFVASFVGLSVLLPGNVRAGAGDCLLGRFPAPGAPDGPAAVLVRPEWVGVAAAGGVAARVRSCLYRGDRWLVRYVVSEREVLGYSDRPRAEGETVLLRLTSDPVPLPGDEARA